MTGQGPFRECLGALLLAAAAALLSAGPCPTAAEEPKASAPLTAAPVPKSQAKPAPQAEAPKSDAKPAPPSEAPKPPPAPSPPPKPAPAPTVAPKPAPAPTVAPKPAPAPTVPPKPAPSPPPKPAPPAEPQVPYIGYIFTPGGQVGKTIEVTVGGLHLQGATTVRTSGKGVSASLLESPAPDAKDKTAPKAPVIKRADGTTEQTETIRISVTIAPDATLGQRDLRVITPGGISNRFRFLVGQLPEVNEVEPNSEKAQAQQLPALPVVVNGQILQADRDIFRFPARAGETLVFAVQARQILPFIPDAVPAWLKAVLTLYDADGTQLAYADTFRFSPDPVLIYTVPKDGQYLIEIRDALYRGREDFAYRLTLGALPYITHLFPLGAQRGTSAKVELHGANLPDDTLSLQLPADAPPLWHVGVTRDKFASNVLPFDVGDRAETAEVEPNDSERQAGPVKVPVTINGRIGRPGDVDFFTFAAAATQELVIEVRARRLGSPLDSLITLFDAQGRTLAQNDDAVDESQPLLTHQADSRLSFTFPSAGQYAVRIADAQGKGGEEYAYRLSIAPPRPDFALRVFPDNVRIGRGDTAAVTATVVRQDGFDGEVRLSVKGLPQGFVVRGATIPPKENALRFTITAPLDAPAGLLSPTVVGTGKIADQEVVRQASPAEQVMQAFGIKHRVPTQELAMAVAESEFFTLATGLAPDKALEVPQGGEAQVTVKAVRGNKGKGQIRLFGDQPPRGITVKSATLAPDKDEAAVTLSASKQAVVGYTQNVVIAGALKVGKDTITRVTPVVPIKVVAAPPQP
jgi:hypothetical protein